MTEEYSIKNPNRQDVLAGRGNLTNLHPGNITFRRLIMDGKFTYTQASNEGKKKIASRIIGTIQNAKPPGRFLEQNKDTGLWDCMCYAKALRKTCQRLRDHQSESYSSIVEDERFKYDHTTYKNNKRKRQRKGIEVQVGNPVNGINTEIKTEVCRLSEIKMLNMLEAYDKKIASLHPKDLACVKKMKNNEWPTKIFNRTDIDKDLKVGQKVSFNLHSNESLSTVDKSEMEHLAVSSIGTQTNFIRKQCYNLDTNLCNLETEHLDYPKWLKSWSSDNYEGDDSSKKAGNQFTKNKSMLTPIMGNVTTSQNSWSDNRYENIHLSKREYKNMNDQKSCSENAYASERAQYPYIKSDSMTPHIMDNVNEPDQNEFAITLDPEVMDIMDFLLGR